MTEPDRSELGKLVEADPELRRLKQVLMDRAHDHDETVEESLPLSAQNDPVYIQPANRKKAEWFAEIWHQEGEPTVHPRGMHYQILGKGYTKPDSDEVYGANDWTVMKEGAKYARALRLVDPAKIPDEKNPAPSVRRRFVDHDAKAPEPRRSADEHVPRNRSVLGSATVPSPSDPSLPELKHDDAEGFIDEWVDDLAEAWFRRAEYPTAPRQPYYMELWAEKSGVLPAGIATESDVSIREAGGGEFSYRQCWDAVRRAAKHDQGLVVVLVTDFDPKGRHMPISVARKIEFEAARQGVEAIVHHGAVTKAQVQEYGIPGEPGKVPEGSGSGAKAYETQKQQFSEFADQNPVEIQAFATREPEAFQREIEAYFEPYFDPELQGKIHEFETNAKELVEEEFKKSIDSDGVAEKWDELETRLDEGEDEVAEDFAEIQDLVDRLSALTDEIETEIEAMELDDMVKQVTRAGAFDAETARDEAMESDDWEVPEGEAEEPDVTPILDTRWSMDRQLDRYDEVDYRTE